MSLPDPTPKLPKLPFLLGDAALLVTAALIAHSAANPFAGGALVAIVGCVVAAGVLGVVPFLVDYATAQDDLLDERQRALEALARTVTTSAEQLAIVARGCHEIAELAQKNLRHADQLPHKLQEKIAEFQAQLAIATDAEKEELEKELIALRTSESERLESISDKIFKATAEWAKLEAAAQARLAAAQAGVGAAETQAADALAKQRAQTAAALAQQHADAAAAFTQQRAQITALTDAHTAATAALGAKLAAFEQAMLNADVRFGVAGEAAGKNAAATAVTLALLDAKLFELDAAMKALAAPPPPAPVPAPVSASAAATSSPQPPAAEPIPADLAVTAAAITGDAPAKTEATAHPPKRPRKPRREEPVADDAPPPAPAAATDAPPPVDAPVATVPGEPAPAVASAIATPAPEAETSPEAAPAVVLAEPAPPAPEPTDRAPAAPEPQPAAPVAPLPMFAEKIPEVAPIAPPTSEPAPVTPPAPVAPAPPAAAAVAPVAESTPPAEPAPVPAAKIAEVAPVAPHTTEPFPSPTIVAPSDESPEEIPPRLTAVPFEPRATAPAAEPSVAPAPSPSPASADATPTAPVAPAEATPVAPAEPAADDPSAKPARKRAAKKPPAAPADDEPSLGLELEEPAAAAAESVLTSDGATRLIATAYIGIGNRLFIRGEGPGLSWEKGVPLQFVSIGKWRWETHEATAPVSFKLYKNDDLESTALGARTLEPGHQHEFTAGF
ncbi:MAG: hypothetical protein RLZZ15_2570 [Verrucomicrobiota bacterium]|jgi:hypothetical protein